VTPSPLHAAGFFHAVVSGCLLSACYQGCVFSSQLTVRKIDRAKQYPSGLLARNHELTLQKSVAAQFLLQPDFDE
jgi:hypothetical protein